MTEILVPPPIEIDTIARSLGRRDSRLWRFVARYERDDAAIEDIIQDTLVEVLRCHDKFKGESSAETWILGVAANVARKHVAGQVLRGKRTVSLDAMVEQAPDALERNWGSELASGPEQRAARQEELEKIARATEGFTPELRATFELAFVHELSYGEIAEQLGIPKGTVRSRLHRVRAILGDALGGVATETAVGDDEAG